ncbi:TetR/AcrR family transcriptional regulator [Planctomycetaceae bacterium SH139]
METLTPKQRELRERESRILELARPMIAGGGMAALSMEAIASELKLARGTVYNHFPNKEEIILALAIQAVEQRLAIFNEAVTMRGTPRERVAAIGIGCEIFADHFPELFRVEYIIRHDLVWEKTSPRRQSLLRSCEGRCMHTVAGVVRDAIANGDLHLKTNSQIEDIVFGLWSLVYGSLLLEMTSPSLADIGIVDSRRAIRRNCNALLDGLGWQPLYCPDAYAKWAAHVSQTLVARFVSLEST